MSKSALALVLVFAATPAWTGEAAAPVVEQLENCAEMQDTRQRLACFDREFAPFRTRKPAPAAAAPAAAAPVPESFGQEKLRTKVKPETREVESTLHAHIAALREVNPDSFLVTLDNGQIWRHADQRLGSFLREGDAITIRKASLGTYRLTRDDGAEKAWIRATRVR